MATPTKPQVRKNAGPALGIGVYVVAALVILGAVAVWYMQTHPGKNDLLALTPDAKEYVKSLKLSEVGIKANESYLKQMVVEIDGKITNGGNRPLDQVEVYCVFYDTYQQVVLRERVPIVKVSTGGLKPGDTKSFRLPFDTVSDNWNHVTPQIVIAGIRFAQ